jgi:hypothetical protein
MAPLGSHAVVVCRNRGQLSVVSRIRGSLPQGLLCLSLAEFEGCRTVGILLRGMHLYCATICLQHSPGTAHMYVAAWQARNGMWMCVWFAVVRYA